MSSIVLDTLHRDRTSWDEIKANLPQNETHDLIVSLRSMSQGTGFFTWAYDHLQEVSPKLAETQAAQSREEAA